MFRSMIPAAVVLAVLLSASIGDARAHTYRICLRLPVTLDDETGMATEVGTSGNWIARGIRIAFVKDPHGHAVAGFPKHAGASDGCFTFSSHAKGDFRIGIQPFGRLAAGNTLKVVSGSGRLFTYVAILDIQQSGVYVWPYERILPRMYAITAYAIQSGFRGKYDNENLTVWYGANSPCNASCNTACSVDGNNYHIAICEDDTRRKFLLGHEYGHVNLTGAAGPYTNDCSYGSPGHGMRGIEYSSCAAMEGWAHFVAADVWNRGEHAGGDPVGWFRYWGGGNALINVEAGQGGCATQPGDTALNYRRRYGDVCFSDPDGWQYDSNCAGGDCDGFGAELDWMRAWWDYHTDGDLPGTRPSHAGLHQHVKDALNWTKDTAYEELLDAVSESRKARFRDASIWNGTSEPISN